MKKLNIFLIGIFTIIFVILLIFIIIYFSKVYKPRTLESFENDIVSNNELNSIIEDNINTNEIENIIGNTIKNEEIANSKISSANTSIDTVSNQFNNAVQTTNTNTNTNKNKVDLQVTTDNKQTTNENKIINEPTKDNNVEITISSNSSQNTQEESKKDSSRPELAYSTYRKENKDNVQEIINILNSEISKDQELVDLGTKAIKGNKKDAYNNTSCFTYLLVNDIQKGKTPGNYTSFPQRVKNNVGCFGTYYVYVEDEYTYNAQGQNPMWSQTLVWIYVQF